MNIKERARLGLPLDGVLIIDAHAHMGPWYNFYIPGDHSIEGMVALMDKLGVAQTCIAPHVGIGPDFKTANDMMLSAVARFPERVIGLATFNPNYPQESGEELFRCFGKGAKGIKIHPDTHDCRVQDRNYEIVWKFAEERKCFVLSHTWQNERCSPRTFIEIAARHPNVVFLLGHSGGTHRGYREAIEAAREGANIYLEICGSEFSSWWLEDFAREAGVEKIIYGTDFPFIDPRITLGRVIFSSLDDASKRKILGENFQERVLSRSLSGRSSRLRR